MSGINDGGPAFPCMPPQDTVAGAATGYPYPDAGMTLRDYFAAKAMLGAVTNPTGGDGFSFDERAVWAYMQADAMLKARAAAPEGEAP